MKQIKILRLILSLLLASSCSNTEITSKPYKAEFTERTPSSSERVQPIIPLNQEELQRTCMEGLEKAPKEILLSYRAYISSYNPIYRISNYIKHEIYKEALEQGCVKRADKFITDQRISTNFGYRPVFTKDYTNTGYDRGHLAPSADFNYNKDTNNESFYMTNMSPQTPDLNQKAWAALEGRVRRFACGFGHLKVYTGPIINGVNLPRLESCVSVPEKFFKVILSDKPGDFKAIGFIYSQSDSHDVWKERAVSVKTVEKESGISFFTELPEDIREKVLSTFNVDEWENSEVDCRRCGDKLLPAERKDF